MPVTPPDDRDWIEFDISGPLAVWCDFASDDESDPGVSVLLGREVRGDGGIVIPGKKGRFPVNPVVDALQVDLRGCIYGDYDVAGDPVVGFENVQAQLDSNRGWLIGTVFDPPGGDGTKVLTYHQVGGNVFSGPAIVIGKLGLAGYTPVSQRFALTVVLTDGGLELEGS